MRGKSGKIFLGIVLGAFLLVSSAHTALCVSLAERPKNIILMISDGQGFNTVTATDYYRGTTAVYEDFDVKYGMQTNSANNPAGYNPASMASNFNYAKTGATDSASAATAMYTGQKIFDGQVNMTTTGLPLTTFFEEAAQAGKSIGIEETALFSDKNFRDLSGLVIGLKEAISLGVKRILILTNNAFVGIMVKDRLGESYMDYYGFYPDIKRLVSDFEEVVVKVVGA